MSKKYMVRCDIEGVTGVVSYEQAEPGKGEYGQRMFMSDLLALLDGLREGGADEVVIYDEHYYGRNIDMAAMPSWASAICGKPPYLSDWPGGLDKSFTGVILLGFHSKAGTKRGLLNHSYELDIQDLRLNDVSVGEIGMEAAIAGDYGVPVVMITADSAGVAEAENLFPGICSVVVKESLSESGGRCYPVKVTAAKIQEAAEAIVVNPPMVKPYKVGKKVRLEVELRDGSYLDGVLKLFKEEMIDRKTLLIKGKSATDVWAKYWQKKLDVQAMMDNRA